MRLFLAITVPPDVRREIVAATAPLREMAPGVAWVDEGRLHLTLKFLDEQPAERLDAIQAALAQVAARHREPDVSLGGVGAFPNFRRARVVWLGVAQEPRLELLHHDIEMTYSALGFDVEARPFRPHLTLGRVRNLPPESHLRALARAARRIGYRNEFMVRSIELMQSVRPAPPAGAGSAPATRASGGPSYTTIASVALRSD